MIRTSEFVTEEWNTYFSNGRADKIVGGWKGILYGNYATIDPRGAYNFFSSRNFDPSWLDGGASLTWYLAYSAGKFVQPFDQPHLSYESSDLIVSAHSSWWFMNWSAALWACLEAFVVRMEINFFCRITWSLACIAQLGHLG